MTGVVVIGSQWGDEGKGKIVDWLSSQANVVIRFQGGHNAGHTLVIDGETYKLNILPSGILRSEKKSIIGNGVVLDLSSLINEIDKLTERGVKISPENLYISDRATIILPLHQHLDELRENNNLIKIGTTKRGIGPAYEDKVARRALRLCDLFDKSKFAISTEETRYYLNGVYMHVAESENGQMLRCVATDGHRLAKVDAPLPQNVNSMPGVIIPRKTVGELGKLLNDDDIDIAVSVSETKVRFATANIQLTSKVIDGTFPDYSRVIPAGNTKRLEVDANEFAKAVDRVSTVSSERSRAVKLALDEDRLILSVNAPDNGAADEEVAVSYGDESLEIGFNAKYLLEIAGQVDRENAVFLFNSSGDPALITEGEDTSAVYVVMPMRV